VETGEHSSFYTNLVTLLEKRYESPQNLRFTCIDLVG
jgi:hypothetical protein